MSRKWPVPPCALGLIAGLGVPTLSVWAQTPGPDATPFIVVNEPALVLRHVRLIDGSGSPARDDQSVVVANGRIAAVGPAASTAVSAGAKLLDYPGYTVIPGLVGMHEHLYYTASVSLQRHADGSLDEPGYFVDEIPFTAPRLYLAAGVTTARTTGSVEPYTDIQIKRRIDAGRIPGPRLDLTSPYLEGPGTQAAQMYELTGPDDAGRLVDYWAQEGITSFKAYMHLSRQELRAAIAQAHKRRLKLTGHLCSVTWPEAIAAGIDDLEHGPVFTDTELVPDKAPDTCPSGKALADSWQSVDIDGARVRALIDNLVQHRVAVTSTLAVLEVLTPGGPPPQQRVLDAMSAAARDSYLAARKRIAEGSGVPEVLLKKEMQFEYAFARRAACYSPAPTRPGMAAPCPVSATSGRSSCWSKPDSPRSRRSRLPPRTGRATSVERRRSAPSPPASAPISSSSKATPLATSRRSRTSSSCSRTASATTRAS